jgi:myxalamid-type polyketide synthase MxaB/epothilone polyketide synthase D
VAVAGWVWKPPISCPQGRAPSAAGGAHAALSADHPRLRELESRGVSLSSAAADIADAGALSQLLADHAAAGRPGIRGVLHAAGVWHDQPLLELSDEGLRKVLRPKVAGTRALDAFLPDDLDFFVGFSAFSSLLPAEGQGNYAAANAFMDASLVRRRAGGAAALAVNWGPWSEVGFAATEYGRRAHARLESLGIARLTPAQGFAWLDRLMGGERVSVGLMPVDWRKLFAVDPNAKLSPLLSELHRAVADAGAGDDPPGRIAAALAGLSSPEQREHLRGALRAMVAKVVRLRQAEIGDETPFTELGVDSLMAVEIKNRIQHDAGVNLPLVKLLEGPSVTSLADRLLASMKVSALSAPVTGASVEEIVI